MHAVFKLPPCSLLSNGLCWASVLQPPPAALRIRQHTHLCPPAPPSERERRHHVQRGGPPHFPRIQTAQERPPVCHALREAPCRLPAWTCGQQGWPGGPERVRGGQGAHLHYWHLWHQAGSGEGLPCHRQREWGKEPEEKRSRYWYPRWCSALGWFSRNRQWVSGFLLSFAAPTPLYLLFTLSNLS